MFQCLFLPALKEKKGAFLRLTRCLPAPASVQLALIMSRWYNLALQTMDSEIIIFISH
jgi:hypothetical protein